MQYDIKVLPIMVGSIGTGKEESIGKLISPFLSNRGIFTVISSDFCHCKCDASLPYFLNNQCMLTLLCLWTLYHSKIMQGVGDSDTRLSQRKRMGRSMKYMNLLNTWTERECISSKCNAQGTFPIIYASIQIRYVADIRQILVWLHSVRESVLAHEVRFVKYEQSEKARSTRDHSVSYAGAVSRVAMDGQYIYTMMTYECRHRVS